MISPANHVPLSPLSFLARARRVFPGKVAVIDGDGTAVSYAEFGRDCDALAGALRADGVQQGDRVAVLDFNSRWLLAAHFGVPGSGARNTMICWRCGLRHRRICSGVMGSSASYPKRLMSK